MAWRVEPTVMLGRQPTNRERSEYRLLQTQQYTHFRRKSGGGCIYADKGWYAVFVHFVC